MSTLRFREFKQLATHCLALSVGTIIKSWGVWQCSFFLLTTLPSLTLPKATSSSRIPHPMFPRWLHLCVYLQGHENFWMVYKQFSFARPVQSVLLGKGLVNQFISARLEGTSPQLSLLANSKQVHLLELARHPSQDRKPWGPGRKTFRWKTREEEACS